MVLKKKRFQQETWTRLQNHQFVGWLIKPSSRARRCQQKQPSRSSTTAERTSPPTFCFQSTWLEVLKPGSNASCWFFRAILGPKQVNDDCPYLPKARNTDPSKLHHLKTKPDFLKSNDCTFKKTVKPLQPQRCPTQISSAWAVPLSRSFPRKKSSLRKDKHKKNQLPGVTKGCFLEVFKYSKASKKHSFVTPGKQN